MPYRDTLSRRLRRGSIATRNAYKKRPDIGAIYGHVAADLTALGSKSRRPT